MPLTWDEKEAKRRDLLNERAIVGNRSYPPEDDEASHQRWHELDNQIRELLDTPPFRVRISVIDEMTARPKQTVLEFAEDGTVHWVRHGSTRR